VEPRLARRVKAAGVALVAAGLVGCGAGASSRSTPPSADHEWVANASGVIDQLDEDVSAVTAAGTDLVAARRALHDESDLFALLVAYSDFGGCNKMVAGVGEAPPHFRVVVRDLTAACGRFERGAALFTAAASRTDARALLAASRQVKAAAVLLYRATLRLAAARTAQARTGTS
jgi:hypothetical protein